MVYVHVPFCRSFCTYCGFYSEICRSASELEYYADAVIAEARSRKDEIIASETATGSARTLYIGGGTPSALPLDVLSRIVRNIPHAGEYEEFTLEVNPDDIVRGGREYVRGLRNLGVSRVSMGIQSFDDGILRWMNRRHDSAAIVQAFNILREEGIGNISLDLIFGISVLSEVVWADTVRRTLELRPEHISAYQLSVEEDSALEKMIAEGTYAEASEALCGKQYSVLCQMLKAAGYEHYEISNFALPGYESRHNSSYWRRVPYVGLGPAAHSFDGTVRRWNSSVVSGSGDIPWTATSETLTAEDIRLERLMLGLRTAAGLPAEELYSLSDKATIDKLLADSLLQRTGPNLRIPEDKFFISDEIIRLLA